MASTMLHLQRPFTAVKVDTSETYLVYEITRTPEEFEVYTGQAFRNLEIAALADHWQDVLMTRVRKRYLFAACSSFFISEDKTNIRIYIRARDQTKRDFDFFYKEFLNHFSNSFQLETQLDIRIIDMEDNIEGFHNNRSKLCMNCIQQHHFFMERLIFGY